MSVVTGPLKLETVGLDAALQSIASLGAAVHVSDRVAQRLVDAFDSGLVLGDDLVSLFRREPIDGAAGGASELHRVRVVPSDRYIELVSAICADGDPTFSRTVLHGWPILSLNRRSVAEGQVRATGSSEGCAA
ncbi:hypothetical protein [Sphingomonas sp. S2-65]|uniref:hypothetical protein n=1 Tax=Sphingomonas sp. S2-65 TaxID=2903960 RepID=UPI001F26265A|nr:hypothetical protein [Sphingomonas sp. S2-65]UYY60128.1 hypothetical protein LZ586_08640 [Sphingomonas sp. S2-65]